MIVNRAPRVIIKCNAVLADLTETLNDVLQTVRLNRITLLLLFFVLVALNLLVFLLVFVVIGMKTADLLAPLLLLFLLLAPVGLLNNSCCLV